MTDKEILEYALAAYEKAAADGWSLWRLNENRMDCGICLFLFRTLRVDYEKTANILKIGEGKNLYVYPRDLPSPLDGIIYRRDYLRKLLND